MNTVISVFKRLRLERVLIVFLAGILLFVSTACGQGSSVRATNPESGQTGKYQSSEQNPRKDSEAERRATPYPKQGASDRMNNFPDTDARRDTSGTDAKAKSLIDKSKRNLSKVESREDFIRASQEGPKIAREKAQDLAEGAGSAVKGLAEDVTKGTQRAARNLRENVQDATSNVSDGVDRALR